MARAPAVPSDCHTVCYTENVNATPLLLTVGHNTVTALLGRNQTPLDQADPGLQAQFHQALTDHAGPLASGPHLLVDGRLVPQ